MTAKIDFKIEKFSALDIAQACKIDQECFSQPWTENMFLDTLKNENTYFLKAVNVNELLGYIGIYYVNEESYIYNLAIKKVYRNLGIATKLVEHVMQFCDKKNHFKFLSLEVRKSNFQAQKLYQKFGFKAVGERKNYYSFPNEDALILTYFFNGR